MALYRVEALVLRSRELGEADRLLTLFAREEGKLRAVARGSRRPRSRLVGATQAFCYGRYLLAAGRELDTVSQADLLDHSLRPLREDLGRMAAASLTAELVDALVEERAPSEGLFGALLTAWRALAGHPWPDLEPVLWWFELRALDLLGYAPALDRCAACQAPLGPDEEGTPFSPQEGGCLCRRCRSRDPLATRLSAQARHALIRLRGMEEPGPAQPALAASHRRPVRQALLAFVQRQLGAPLKSAGVVEALVDEWAGPSTGAQGGNARVG